MSHPDRLTLRDTLLAVAFVAVLVCVVIAVTGCSTVPPTVAAMPVWHLDGVSWSDADPPRRWHRHWAQTQAVVDREFLQRWGEAGFAALGGGRVGFTAVVR